MTLEARARAFAATLQRSTMRVDPAAGLEELLRRRRRRRITRAAAALATAAAVALVAWVAVRESERVAPITNPPPGSLGRVTATIPVGPSPADVLAGQEAVWVANPAQGTVSRGDPATNTVTKTIRVGRGPGRLAAGFGSIWVANATEQTVSRIDPQTGRVAATIPGTGGGPSDLAVGAGAVWVTEGARLMRIDPATDKLATIPLLWDSTAGGIAVVDRLLWLSGAASSHAGGYRIIRVDPSTNRMADTVTTAGEGELTVGGGSVWQAGIATQTVYRLDPKSGRTLAEIPVGVVAKHLTAGDGSLWVGGDSGRVTCIDMATNKVTGTFQVSGRAAAVAVGYGSVWIVDTAHAALLRVQPTS
jgi:YVTN family beta-propeller protein